MTSQQSRLCFFFFNSALPCWRRVTAKQQPAKYACSQLTNVSEMPRAAGDAIIRHKKTFQMLAFSLILKPNFVAGVSPPIGSCLETHLSEMVKANTRVRQQTSSFQTAAHATAQGSWWQLMRVLMAIFCMHHFAWSGEVCRRTSKIPFNQFWVRSAVCASSKRIIQTYLWVLLSSKLNVVGGKSRLNAVRVRLTIPRSQFVVCVLKARDQ